MFELCDYCFGRISSLKFDEKAECRHNIEPFLTLIWTDELPSSGPPITSWDEDLDEYFPLDDHRKCRASLVRLMAARTHRWEHGNIPDQLSSLWSAAIKRLPDWPGFRRLILDDRLLNEIKRRNSWDQR